MAEIKIAGIMRAGAFSPNHIGNDAAIFNIVAEQLRKRGCIVNVYSEEQFATGTITENIILNMCREQRSLDRLQQLEDNGAIVINSGYGIENSIRERLTRILVAAGIPYPESFIVDTDEVVKSRLQRAGIGACWVKLGEAHARHREDVAYARHPQEAQEIIQEFFLRGIKHAVINRHIEGEPVKFYGVAGTPFFYWFHPFDNSQPRHGAATRTDQQTHTPFDVDKFKDICTRAANEIGIKIYGGDCIITPEGNTVIVDFDDFPSFAPCRQEAAPVIARMIINEIKNR